MRTGIIGLGNLGAAVANLVAGNGHEVIGWEFSAAVVDEINRQHTNAKFLPDVVMHQNLTATTDLAAVFQNTEVVFIAIPSVFVQRALQPLRGQIAPEIVLVNMAKGIDGATGLTSFQTLSGMFPDNPRVMLSGPSIANEFAHQLPTVVVIAGRSKTDLMRVARALDNDHFRTRFSDDEIGVELGGILKNIYAIGLGLFDGENITSVNFRSVYLTLAIEEITRVGVALGAKVETFLYLSGIGDLLATSLSGHSHNRRMGELLAQGLSRAEIEKQMGVTPEGYNTLRSMLYIAEKMHVAMPLAKGLWDVINGRYSANKFIQSFIRDFVE
jgi:glycerol-3-phosphate dehydrogenase (NAD(P)+)